jgi:hypothetical protein
MACGCDVPADGDKPMHHQVFKLLKIEPIVTEYVRLRGVCNGCGQKHHGILPVGVPNGQLGPRALALVGTLAGQFHLTPRRVQDVLAHIMGIRFSLGTVSQAHGLVSQALAAPVAQPHGLDPHRLLNKTAKRELVFFGQHKSSDNTTNCAWRGRTAARHDLVSR